MAPNNANVPATDRSALPDLVRPRFFPGQLLTDRDLTDLVAWIRARFGLDRLREGWGAVCGWGVSTNPKRPWELSIEPGYGVDAAGNDLYFTETIKTQLALDDVWPGDASALKGANDVAVGPFRYPTSEVAIFDLFLQSYDAETGLVPVANGPTAATHCQASRNREAVRAHAKRWRGPATAAEKEPAPDYFKLLTDVKNACSALFNPPSTGAIDPKDVVRDAGAVRQLLAREFSEHPATWLRVLPELPAWLRSKPDDDEDPLATPWGLARVLFWMADSDRRGQSFCPQPCPDDGIPIARVWAHVRGRSISVFFIDARPPYRRVYGPDAAGIDLRPYVGQEFESAKQALSRQQLTLKSEVFEFPATAARLEAELTEEHEKLTEGFAPGTEAVARVYRSEFPAADGKPDEPLAGRIVGFRSGSKREPLTTADTSLECELYSAEGATPGKAELVLDATIKASTWKKLDAKAIPYGATIRAVVRPTNLAIAALPHVTYFDNIRLQFDDLTEWKAAHAVVAVVPIPATADVTPRLTATLLVRLPKDGRVVAVSKTFDQPLGNYPLRPQLSVVPWGKDQSFTKWIPVIAGSKLPVRVLIANETPSEVKGKLHCDNTPPTPDDAKKTEKTLGDVASQPSSDVTAGAVGPRPVTLAKLTDFGDPDDLSRLLLPVNRPDWYFWLTNMTDDFGRKKDVVFFTASSTLHVEAAKPLDVKVTISVAAGLKIANDAAKELTVTQVQAHDGSSQPQPFDDVGAIAPTKNKLVKLTGVTAGPTWKVRIAFVYEGQPSAAYFDIPATAT